MSTKVVCIACSREFISDRGLQLHWTHRKECFNKTVNTKGLFDTETLPTFFASNNINNKTNDVEQDFETNFSETNPVTYPDDYDLSLFDLSDQYEKTKIQKTMEDEMLFQAHVELINMLKDNNSPLYMFDEIMKWVIRCNNDYKILFNSKNVQSRDSLVSKIKTQFDLDKLSHITKLTTLPGSQTQAKRVCHDFKMCLYSILNDKKLMVEDNLILNRDNIF